MRSERFTLAAAAVALLSCPLALVAPFLLGAAPGPRGGISISAIVGAVFAGYNAYAVRAWGRPYLPAALLAALFGAWLVLAPLQYQVGAALTATTQFAGMLLAAFSGFTALEALVIDGEEGRA